MDEYFALNFLLRTQPLRIVCRLCRVMPGWPCSRVSTKGRKEVGVQSGFYSRATHLGAKLHLSSILIPTKASYGLPVTLYEKTFGCCLEKS